MAHARASALDEPLDGRVAHGAAPAGLLAG